MTTMKLSNSQSMHIALKVEKPQGTNFSSPFLYNNLEKHVTKLVPQEPGTFPFNFISI